MDQDTPYVAAHQQGCCPIEEDELDLPRGFGQRVVHQDETVVYSVNRIQDANDAENEQHWQELGGL